MAPLSRGHEQFFRRDGKEKAPESAKSSKEQPENASLGSRIASSAAGLAKDLVGHPDHAAVANVASASTNGSSKTHSSANGPSASNGEGSSSFVRATTGGYHSGNTSSSAENFRSFLEKPEGASDLRDFLSEDGLESLERRGNRPSSTWRNEFFDSSRDQSHSFQDVHYDLDTSNGGPVQYDDGAEVRALLSRTEFQVDDDPQQVMLEEPSSQSVADLFPQNFNAEEQEAVNRIKSTLPPPPVHNAVHPRNPINLIPGVEELAASLEDGEESYLNYSTPQREHWLHEWEEVLESYTDQVWAHGWEGMQGDLSASISTVEETRSRLQEVAAKKGTLDGKSVERLKMILGHVLQNSVTADQIPKRQDQREEKMAEDDEITIPTFHCPWISCHQRFHNLVDLQQHSSTHRRFECPHTECGANFSRAQEWTEHITLAHHNLLDPGGGMQGINVGS